MNAKTAATTQPVRLVGEKLERRLEELLHQERFAPPHGFVATSGSKDASLHARPEVARPKCISWSEDLPKTRSGKIMRRLLRDIAEGPTLGDVTTLRDPTVMAELEQKIAAGQAGDE